MTSDLRFQLHFSKPSVYNEIYNVRNRWAKDPLLYQSFAEDISTFTMSEYSEAKQRRDILLPLFSRKATIHMQDLVSDKVYFISAVSSRFTEANMRVADR